MPVKLCRLLALALVVALAPATPRQIPGGCGTSRERLQEDLLRHRVLRGPRRPGLPAPQAAGAGAKQRALARDLGPTSDLAVIDAADGVVSPPNDFNLDSRTLAFLPSANASRYRFSVSDTNTYDQGAVDAGAAINGLGDDDARQFNLPFAFPFFGKTYTSVWVNSDGNLTFLAADTASSERSLGRQSAGPPRISPLFGDLDPSRTATGVRVLSDATRFVVSWVSVPEYTDSGVGARQTFQVRLNRDGRVEFAYNGINTTGAVVGIAPGSLQGSSTVVHFVLGSSLEYTAAVAERFGALGELDLVTVAQKFYEAHDDSYDYLVIFNRVGIADSASSIASERTVRNNVAGTGDIGIDAGQQFGSARRLQSVINMGDLMQYGGLYDPMLERPIDTPLTVLAHEAGHLFLAYASAADPVDPEARPMLGFQNAHWSFNFNSDASLVEGNRILDRGSGATPRFRTTAASQGFSALDQYLMGLRAPEDVEPAHELFYVAGSPYSNNLHPRVGISLNGERRDVRVADVIAREGRRTPDHTVAPRSFRFAFILVTAEGAEPTAAELQKLEDFRHGFEEYFHTATSGRGTAETTLRRALRMSVFPAGGVVAGAKAPVSVSVERAPETSLQIALSAGGGFAGVPASVMIPAGATKAAFEITGLRAGVDELTATPSDARYETAAVRVQVAASAAALKLSLVSAGPNPVVFQVVDQNNLPYPGVRVTASVTGGGTLAQSSAVTDETGLASFAWTQGTGVNRLTATIAGGASMTIGAPGMPSATAEGVVNAASFAAGLAPGSLGSIFGVNLWAGFDADAAGQPLPITLGEVQVTLNGTPLPLLAVRELQINFFVPQGTAVGAGQLVVATPSVASAPVPVTISTVAPGIFFNPPSGPGAMRRNGDYLEIYATGLGSVHASAAQAGLYETDLPVTVLVDSERVAASFAGLAPGFTGLYQVNVKAAPGKHTVAIEVGAKRSNVVDTP